MKQPLLPPPSSTFHLRKSKILSQLSLPDEQYTDLSPKGSVDVGIRDLISEINAREGLVTTSSCAGRVSVYLEGCKKPKQSESQEEEKEEQEEGKEEGKEEIVNSSSAVGGKGGGEWLFVSHDPVGFQEKYEGLFGLQPQPREEEEEEEEEEEDEWENKKEEPARLVHFKFEPMVCLFRHSLSKVGICN
jgi:tRNA wybutosine-synthesizing protein 3